MPRGGRRNGTPGKGYGNRTDLMSSPDMTKNTAASGGMVAPAQSGPPVEPAALQGPAIGADQVPNLSDPTMRPNEPVTAGLPLGLGAGPEALGIMPPQQVDPVRQVVEALMLISPNPDLYRIQSRLDYEGR